MPTATIVRAWKDANAAYLAVRVLESKGAMEYIGSIRLEDLVDKTPGEQKAVLVSMVKAARDKQVAGPSELPISGTVTI